MYERINIRMTKDEAVERYPNSIIAMQKDSRESNVGTVLCIGNDDSDVISFLRTLDARPECLIMEGRNLRCSLGGVVVGV